MSNVVLFPKGNSSNQSPPRAVYSKNEVAASLGVSAVTVDRLWKAGKIRSIRIAGRRMFPASELARVAEQGA